MFHKDIIVPENYIGLVIGKKGRTIKRLECKHSVKIVFIDEKFNFYSSNSMSDIDNAIESVLKIYQGACKTTEECPICLDTLNLNSNYVVTKCGHKFHFDCLMKATETKIYCPICRQKVLEKDDLDVDKIIKDTILLMRRTNYWVYLYSYIDDIFNIQVVLEQFIREPLRYALSRVN